ncbi:MAG: TonB-dependent receptor [Paludibacter sp.]|nr:TonB-dependent receptor [Paludibacter sp.]
MRIIKINGLVLNRSGEALVGANLIVKGAQKGVITDFDGKFVLDVPIGATLSISYIGYDPQEFLITDKKEYRIVLEEDSKYLDEVVVIGYGESQRRDLTGSISAIKSDQLTKFGATDLTAALQGRVAGVQIKTSSGEPGAGMDIVIRGANSLNAGIYPLYVIDGMQIDINESEVARSSVGGQATYNPLSSINPNDIASIDILKDASATAIYGSRGANGVIIITTKSGSSSDRTDVSFNSSVGLNQIANSHDMLDAQGYVDYKFSRGGGDQNVWGKDYGEGLVPKDVILEGLKTYNWEDEMTRLGITQNYDVSMNGQSNKTRFSASLGYLNQKGVILSNDFSRYSGRLKLDHEISKKLSAGCSVTLGRTNSNGAISSGSQGGTSAFTGVVQLMYLERPLNLYTDAETDNELTYGYTPLTSMVSGETYKNTKFDRLLGNAYIVYKPIQDLSIRLNGSTSNTYSKMMEFYTTQSRWGRATKGRAGVDQINTDGYTLSLTANYYKTFVKKHKLNAMIGGEINSYHFESTSMRTESFDDQSTGVFNIGKGQVVQTPSTNVTQTNRMSAFARLAYDYDGRYYANFNIRADASSNFGPLSRVGYFPSVSLAWRGSSEPFLSWAKDLSNLKFRASVGTTGNDRIPSYRYMATMGTCQYAGGDEKIFGMGPNGSENPSLKWESTRQYNVGMDLDLFRNRVSFVADYYYKDTHDMLYNANVAAHTGFARQWQNIGRISNKGIELTLITRNVVKKKFSWTTNINFDANRNKVLELGGESFFPVTVRYGPFFDMPISRVQVGESVGIIYGYVHDGNYQIDNFDWVDRVTREPVDASVITDANMSNYRYTLKSDVTKITGMTVAPGDRKYKNIEGEENAIDVNDRTIIGNSNPKFNMGMYNEFKIGSFDFAFFFECSYGFDLLNSFKVMSEPGLNNITNNITRDSWENRWSVANSSNTYSRIINQTNNWVSSYYVEDGSFVRLKNVNLGYSFDKRKLSKVNISSLRIFVNLDNVLLLTNYSGLDPEVRSPEVFLRGLDQTSYPRTHNYALGINVNF